MRARSSLLLLSACAASVPPAAMPRAEPPLRTILCARATDGDATGAFRAATAAEWRELRERLAAAGVELPASAVDPRTEAVYAVLWPGDAPAESLRLTSEEGVDVVTLTVGGDAGRPGRGCCVFALPQRPNQTAIVLRGPGGEAMLAVFTGS